MSEHTPPGWRVATLGELVKECNDRVGRAPWPVVLSSTKHHGLVPSEDYFRGRIVYSDDLSNYKRVDKEWFAYATNHLSEGSIGLQQQFPIACVSPIYTVFKCKDEVDPKFLYRVLRSPKTISKYGLHEQASVDRRGAVRFRDFSMIRIQLPSSRSEQRCIAEILDAVDHEIRTAEQFVAKLDLVWRGLAQRLLNRGVAESGRVRNPCTEPTQFVNTSLGPLPSMWRILSFGELASYVNGYAFKPEDWSEFGSPIIRIQNINGSNDFNYFEGLADPSCVVYDGDLLFAWSGTRESSFGPTIWRGPRGLLNQHIFNVREKKSIVCRDFLYLLLKHNLERIAASAHGFKDSFVHVKRSDLTSVTVGVPPIDEQMRIVSIAESEAGSVKAEAQRLKALRRVKDALMDDLLTGRVRVTDVGMERVRTG
jgi:type I restriction enzyme S subunit